MANIGITFDAIGPRVLTKPWTPVGALSASLSCLLLLGILCSTIRSCPGLEERFRHDTTLSRS